MFPTTRTTDEIIAELLEQIRELKEHTKKLTDQTTKLDEDVRGITYGQTIQPETTILPSGTTQLAVCNCNCRWLVRGGTIVGHGVSLGMASARDVGALGAAELVILDRGLIAIARRLIPRNAGSGHNSSAEAFSQLLVLFASVNLTLSNWNNGNPTAAWNNFRNTARHGNQRLSDGLTGWRSQPPADANARLAYETVFQMIQFRGINLDIV